MNKNVKRGLLALVGVVVVLVLTVAGLMASAFFGNAALPETADLPGGVRLVKDGFVAFFVLPAGDHAVALVDCGADPTAKGILAELARHNLTADDVKGIFLTHGHGDHTAGCHNFPQATVMALGPDAALAGGTEASRGLLTRWKKNGEEQRIQVGRVVHDGEDVTVGNLTVRVYALPGHTDGSAAYLAHQVLFLGDSATHHSDGRFGGAPSVFSNDVPENHASLRRLYGRLVAEKQPVLALAPAHTAPVMGMTSFAAFAAQAD